MRYCVDCGHKLPDDCTACTFCNSQNNQTEQNVNGTKLHQTKKYLIKVRDYIAQKAETAKTAIKSGISAASDELSAAKTTQPNERQTTQPDQQSKQPNEQSAGQTAQPNEQQTTQPDQQSKQPNEQSAGQTAQPNERQTTQPDQQSMQSSEQSAETFAPSNMPYYGQNAVTEKMPYPPTHVFVPYPLHKAPDNEVYSESGANSDRKKRGKIKSRAKAGRASRVFIFLIILDILLLGSLVLNHTLSAEVMRGIDPVLSFFKQTNKFDALYAGLSSSNKAYKFFSYYKIAYTAFAGLLVLSIISALLFAKLRGAAKFFANFYTALMLVFIAASAASNITAFGSDKIVSALGLIAALALIIIKFIAINTGYKKNR